MTLPTPSVPQSEQRRRGILEAVLRLIAEGGVDAVTHRRVAAEAGVPLGSTTYYFRSREELVLEAFRFYVAANTALYADLDRSGERETLHGLVDLIVTATQRQFDHGSLLLAEYELVLFAARNPDFAREYLAWQRAQAVHLTERLERLGFARPVAAADTVIAAMRGFELDRLARSGRSFDDLRQRIHALLAGLLAIGGASNVATANAKPAKRSAPRPRAASTGTTTGTTTRTTTRTKARPKARPKASKEKP
jgi:DNA-binding transcriptional regulator YbjK